MQWMIQQTDTQLKLFLKSQSNIGQKYLILPRYTLFAPWPLTWSITEDKIKLNFELKY